MYKIGILHSNAVPGDVTPTPPLSLFDIYYDDDILKWGYTGDKVAGITSPINIRVTYTTAIAAQLYYRLSTGALVLDGNSNPEDNDMIPINSGDIIPDVPPDDYVYFGVSAPTSTVTEEIVGVTLTNASLAETFLTSFNAETIVTYYSLNLNTENSTSDALKVMYTVPMFGFNDTLFYNLPATTSCTSIGVATISLPKNSKIYVGMLDTSGNKVIYGVNLSTGFPVPPCPSLHTYCGSFDTNTNKLAVYSLTLSQDSYVSVGPRVGNNGKSSNC